MGDDVHVVCLGFIATACSQVQSGKDPNQSLLPDKTIEILAASPSRGIISVRTNVGDASLGYVVADKIWLRSNDD